MVSGFILIVSPGASLSGILGYLAITVYLGGFLVHRKFSVRVVMCFGYHCSQGTEQGTLAMGCKQLWFMSPVGTHGVRGRLLRTCAQNWSVATENVLVACPQPPHV